MAFNPKYPPQTFAWERLSSSFQLYCDLFTVLCHRDEQPLLHQALRSWPLPVSTQHLFTFAVSKIVQRGVGTRDIAWRSLLLKGMGQVQRKGGSQRGSTYR
ncbi:hypothetical protein XENORESO_009486 [Xenotaenia resolanae]|uniref:Uncharacterized protein n=1 Tax=Xenotaenia resolanae TaxID=208358 RepID=A0ABV0WXW4_9TELE